LGNRSIVERNVEQFGRRVSEVKLSRFPATDLPHAEQGAPAAPQSQSLFDRTDHDDLRGSVGQSHGSGREGTEYVYDGDPALSPASSRKKALYVNFHQHDPGSDSGSGRFLYQLSTHDSPGACRPKVSDEATGMTWPNIDQTSGQPSLKVTAVGVPMLPH